MALLLPLVDDLHRLPRVSSLFPPPPSPGGLSVDRISSMRTERPGVGRQLLRRPTKATTTVLSPWVATLFLPPSLSCSFFDSLEPLSKTPPEAHAPFLLFGTMSGAEVTTRVLGAPRPECGCLMLEITEQFVTILENYFDKNTGAGWLSWSQIFKLCAMF